MKEITNVLTVKLTVITKVKDEEAAAKWVADSHNQHMKREVEKLFERVFGFDNANIVEIQDFVMDVKEGAGNELAEN